MSDLATQDPVAYAERTASFDGAPPVKMAACGECLRGQCDGCEACDKAVEWYGRNHPSRRAPAHPVADPHHGPIR